ncbi:MauE/DoxX family redox-associated membrane protein [Pedobacter sp. ok626]|uniref:MauE/DoxX family redox-associated membrane protein n=1 Tax=Pedobacter sp. ok626 TaxID=1761882 RepID=UPI0020C8603F|nr:MauE/DoxX family redox-associated membrane protein [Pedobacter sp. ok626]
METTMNKQSARVLFSNKTKQIVVEVICYLFVLLWLYAATNKILDFQKFQVQIGQSPILTDYAVIIAWIIPSIEIILSIALLLKRTLIAGLYASFGLMLMFTTYIIIILNFAERVPCSCGGILEKMGWTEHLIFNIGFVILALIAIIFQTQLNENKAR